MKNQEVVAQGTPKKDQGGKEERRKRMKILGQRPL
jgi:hypothetical protein